MADGMKSRDYPMTTRILMAIVGIGATLLPTSVTWADTCDLRVEGKKVVEYVSAKANNAVVWKDGVSMCAIPAGEFQMGSNDDETDVVSGHSVVLDAFYLDQFEVTNRRFQQFVHDTGYQTTAERAGQARAFGRDGAWADVPGASWLKPEGVDTVFASDRAEHPVVSVSWHDAAGYCRHYGKRLPTEAEFEYVLRAGTQTTYWWGNGPPGSRRVANLADLTYLLWFPMTSWSIVEGYIDGYGRTAPVGSFEANPWGLYDMEGNVAEWVADWYDDSYYRHSPSNNPIGPWLGEYRVIRGGSWNASLPEVRSSYRDMGMPDDQSAAIGFRCAQNNPAAASLVKNEVH